MRFRTVPSSGAKRRATPSRVGVGAEKSSRQAGANQGFMGGPSGRRARSALAGFRLALRRGRLGSTLIVRNGGGLDRFVVFLRVLLAAEALHRLVQPAIAAGGRAGLGQEVLHPSREHVGLVGADLEGPRREALVQLLGLLAHVLLLFLRAFGLGRIGRRRGLPTLARSGAFGRR